ncbi:MAG: hypothetical protein H6822_02365 [Planctomycetaceae bacterium]|nr:hypothetical protein [Planctomycetales bacterium]MCB9920994.1 hypothetical protein [Planctomycetaceae bacterium]
MAFNSFVRVWFFFEVTGVRCLQSPDHSVPLLPEHRGGHSLTAGLPSAVASTRQRIIVIYAEYGNESSSVSLVSVVWPLGMKLLVSGNGSC